MKHFLLGLLVGLFVGAIMTLISVKSQIEKELERKIAKSDSENTFTIKPNFASRQNFHLYANGQPGHSWFVVDSFIEANDTQLVIYKWDENSRNYQPIETVNRNHYNNP